MTRKHFSVAIALTIFMFAAFALAQPQQEDKSKRPSPPGTADCNINGKKVTIDYSRPFLKGRKLGTDLAPYGKVWRTGANEATTLTTAIALSIGGAKVPAGTSAPPISSAMAVVSMVASLAPVRHTFP